MFDQRHKPGFGKVDSLILLLILAGIGVLAYPSISDAYVSYRNQAVIAHYQAHETKLNAAAAASQYRQYRRYNQALQQANQAPGLQKFTNTANPSGQSALDAKQLTAETVARLTIPQLQVSLPVFEHTTDQLLQFGACLLDGTSIPIGGAGTHAVISGHRGVPNATLFSHLPQLHTGDRFFITIGKRTLAYRVFKRQVIEPTDLSQLRLVPGEDLVTLMTCTPYMINSQRLLITGRRVAYRAADGAAVKQAAWFNQLKLALWLALFAALIVGLACWVRKLMIAGRTYTLVLPAEAVAAVVQRGKHQQVLAAADLAQLRTKLYGGRYTLIVLTKQGQRRQRIYVKHLRDQQFTYARTNRTQKLTQPDPS
ncbi:class C sortase [Lacticaseibacillus jixiensis]|uniref:class C sortase n=1 Tax=Lacticaseibacillus jixiensis TaxID=3231926 RepID=UPI0036F2A6DB